MDEASRLKTLLDACHDVLPHLAHRDEEIAERIRETCQAIEARLQELTIAPQSVS